MALDYKITAQLGIPLLLFIGLLVWGGARLLDPVLFPLRVMMIEGEIRYLSVPAVQNSLLAEFQQGFFHVDLHAVQQWVEAIPWVYTATVRRVWPDTLKIQVVEQQPLARWRDTQLLNREGVIFTPAQLPSGLLELSGPVGSEQIVLTQYRQMSALLAPIELSIDRLVLNDRLDWEVLLDNGIILKLGREQIQARLARVIKTFHKILVHQPARQIKTIDLRYPNGFAIRWEAEAQGSGDQEVLWPKKT